eukprot:TRINITY_DN11122_c0_g1_i1.p1 TRINITY_DN11122_c0_g1~~TRINITY_DN11122_c0_g1_i1.p1  ORF type:complete len:247 (+),score=30.74 TRINITY_DN11122_c0_g1_i1:99-839(+)
MGGTCDKLYTADEVAEHTTDDSVWLIAHGAVYDVTPMLATHAAGAASILRYAGTDCTRHFNFHSKQAQSSVWKQYVIGKVVPSRRPCNKDGCLRCKQPLLQQQGQGQGQGAGGGSAQHTAAEQTATAREAGGAGAGIPTPYSPDGGRPRLTQSQAPAPPLVGSSRHNPIRNGTGETDESDAIASQSVTAESDDEDEDYEPGAASLIPGMGGPPKKAHTYGPKRYRKHHERILQQQERALQAVSKLN